MEDEDTSALPALPVQERLLDLYFTHVHPSFPVLHKQAFLESFKAGYVYRSPLNTPNAYSFISEPNLQHHFQMSMFPIRLPSLDVPDEYRMSFSSPCFQ